MTYQMLVEFDSNLPMPEAVKLIQDAIEAKQSAGHDIRDACVTILLEQDEEQ